MASGDQLAPRDVRSSGTYLDSFLSVLTIGGSENSICYEILVIDRQVGRKSVDRHPEESDDIGM